MTAPSLWARLRLIISAYLLPFLRSSCTLPFPYEAPSLARTEQPAVHSLIIHSFMTVDKTGAMLARAAGLRPINTGAWPLLNLSIILTSLTLLCVGAHGAELAISLKADKKPIAELRLRIKDDLATVAGPGVTERFDLKGMRWFDERTSQWITMAYSKKWASRSKANTSKTTDSAPPHVQPFLRWSLDPSFKVDKSNGSLRLTSGQVDYLVEGAASKKNVQEFFRYAVLNAYKKAMTEQKLPPFSELKAISEMKSLGRIPRNISVTMPGIPESPLIEMEITEVSE